MVFYKILYTRARTLAGVHLSQYVAAAKAAKLQNAAAAATLKIAAVNLTKLQIWHHEKSNFIIIILKYKCGCNKFDFLFCQIFIALGRDLFDL